MRAYIQYAKCCFKKNLVYKSDYLLGILSTLMSIFIYVSIWKALYKGNTDIDGISFSVVCTSFILSLAISRAFYIDDFIIYRKIQKGEITNELLRPVSFRGLLLAENLGNICFKLIANFAPAVIISSIFVEILPPFSVINFLIFLLSVIFGFFVLYEMSYIVSVSSFWIINVWSISTIKNVFISVLSGTMIPLWFMPETVLNIIKFTPFDSIYFVPINIYLGKVSMMNIGILLVKQLVWISILRIIGGWIWKRAVKRLVVQGG